MQIRDTSQLSAIQLVIASGDQERLFVRRPASGCLLAKEC